MVTQLNPSYYSAMNQEIELKLRLNTRQLPLLEQVLANNQFITEPTLQLLNRYFDTPTMGLSQGGAALRIRQQKIQGQAQAEIIQTLKTRGTSAGGLHQRMEWDWPLTQVELDLELIKNSDAQDHLSTELDLTSIGALFTTDFQRKVWLYQQDETCIEIVLDQGQVSTEEHRIDLLELELELKSGNAEVLFQLAADIAQKCPVLMSDISKAERGYGLLSRSKNYQGIKKDWQGKVPEFDATQDVVTVFTRYFSYQLSLWQRSLEMAIWDQQSHKETDVKWQLNQLQTLLAIFSSIDTWAESQQIKQWLHQAAEAEMTVSLIWGQITLACGRWLYQLNQQGTIKQAMTAAEIISMQMYVEQLTKGINS